ncbi:SIR2 family NAD-dependent protein deacylase [Aliikangiella sp. IMCC44632]
MSLRKQKIVVLSGAGISAESGLKTFRDSNGLWENHAIEDVATPQAWMANRELVLSFYNQRRRQLANCQPNPAHRAIAELQDQFDTLVITQNVDDLHERAGSKNVIHVHGELTKACSEVDKAHVIDIGYKDIKIGDLGADGRQLRPYIVWFGEAVPAFEVAAQEITDAAKVLVVGTSLSVFPVASLVDFAPASAEKVIVSLDLEQTPAGFEFIKSKASVALPSLISQWLNA